jgi:hypothetical protein
LATFRFLMWYALKDYLAERKKDNSTSTSINDLRQW